MEEPDFSDFDEAVKKAVAVLRNGGVILYPTDTVWGLGCDATNETAVRKIFRLKKRDCGKPMLVLVDTEVMLSRYVKDIPDIAWQLIDAAVDPLTIVYDNGKDLAPSLLAPDGSVGVRITDDVFCKKLCAALRRPIVSTSANLSGESMPKDYLSISEEIKNGVDLSVLLADRGVDSTLKPSNIIKVGTGGIIKVIR